MRRESYMQLLRKSGAGIASLLDQGFVFVTNAFRSGQAPPGISIQDCDQMAAKLRGDGWEVVVAAAYSETGQSLPHMASLWRRRP
ncbi:MAG TPA: hypothetical protein VN203_15280 [Candidatus Acidoferrum sp.]|nr:hypothetical protein [Candidatus Methylomirabilis sp.]HWU39012.1 hypothetical protein [Candidatus Acidoferrum sp.]